MRDPQLSKLEHAEARVTAVIAIPAHNEAAHIERGLAALAMQRDKAGAPVRRGAFHILVFANSCADATADIARRFATRVPHPISVIEESLQPGQLSAGWARKRAMDLAAAGLVEQAAAHGVIFTTDADSCVAPTWFTASLREFEKGVDCVAGYIDAQPPQRKPWLPQPPASPNPVPIADIAAALSNLDEEYPSAGGGARRAPPACGRTGDGRNGTSFARSRFTTQNSMTRWKMDNLKNKGAPDRSKINMDADFEVRHWRKTLGVSKEQLQQAVDKVGNSAAAVRKELAA